MDEIIALAAARGVELPADIKPRIFAIAESFDPDWKTSTCNDLEAGKPIEVDSLAGAIHRLGPGCRRSDPRCKPLPTKL